MAESATTTEGTAPAPTPAAPAASSSAASSTPAQSTTANPGHVEAQAKRDAFERRVIEKLDEGLSPAEARKAAEPPDPAPSTQRQPEQPAAGEAGRRATDGPPRTDSTPAAAQTPARNDSAGTAQAAPSPKVADFEGLDPRGLQSLQQSQLLPDPAVWNQMSLNQRTNMLFAAKELIANRSREFQRRQAQNGNGAARGNPPPQGQQLRDAQGRFAPQTTPDEGVTRDDVTPINDDAPAGNGRRQTPPGPDDPERNGNGQRARAQQPSTAQRPKLPQRLQDLAQNLGDDLGQPLLEGLEELNNSHAQQLAAMQQRLDSYEQQNVQNARAQLGREERVAREELADSGLTSLRTDDAAWGKVTAQARLLAQAQYQAEGQWDWGACLKTAANSLFHSDIRQQAQRDLAQQRRTALQGSPERGTENAQPPSSMSKDEWELHALDLLDQGKTPEEIRAARMAST